MGDDRPVGCGSWLVYPIEDDAFLERTNHFQGDEISIDFVGCFPGLNSGHQAGIAVRGCICLIMIVIPPLGSPTPRRTVTFCLSF